MATFKVVVRKKRADGFYPVYIRVVHRSRMGYIKTDKLITDKQITKNGEIKDIVVNEYCSREILRYSDMINRKDVSNYSVAELIEFLIHSDEEICFSDYATKFINRMASEGHERNAKNYRLAVNHLERYLGTTRVMRIKYNPWLKVSIPKSDSTVQRAISAEACREFFNRPLPETKMISSLPELGRDVALLSLCLGGINTVDIFELKKENYKDGVIGYKRAKTKHSRKDEAYIEMRVEPFIQATFDKYLSDENDEYLFKFHKRYSNPDSFNANVNIGIRKICADMGMKKEDYYCYYTFRHTWATIAQNDCDANLYEVAFGMNHSHGLNITRGYVKIDFTPAWELNAKVIDFIFFSSKKSKQGKARDFETPADKMFRITKKMMIYGRAYFKGDVIGEITDIGFSNVDQVIDRLVEQLPKDIPTGCMVQFRLMNCDSKKEVVYERSKGKGFM